MKKRQKTLLYWGIAIVAIVALIWGLNAYSKQPGALDAFASCLGESGAIFYGAYWCPACNEQKAMFGRSQELLPYVECSLPGATGQTQECTELGIEAYPTWDFADGERVMGVVSLNDLAQKTTCQLP